MFIGADRSAFGTPAGCYVYTRSSYEADLPHCTPVGCGLRTTAFL